MSSQTPEILLQAVEKSMAQKITPETAPAFDGPRLSYRNEGFGNPDFEGFVIYDDEPESECGGQRPATMALLVDREVVFEYDFTAYQDNNWEPGEPEIYNAWISSLKESAA